MFLHKKYCYWYLAHGIIHTYYVFWHKELLSLKLRARLINF